MIMDGLRKIIAEDNHEAVKVGDLHREARSKKVVEYTSRAHEGVLRTFTDTSIVGDQRWEPPPVDADWHAFCQAIFQGVEGPEWEAMYVPLQGPASSGEKHEIWRKERRQKCCGP